jgi:hypothetical protein
MMRGWRTVKVFIFYVPPEPGHSGMIWLRLRSHGARFRDLV